jgi:hypothetical protein
VRNDVYFTDDGPCTGGVDEMVGGMVFIYFQVFFDEMEWLRVRNDVFFTDDGPMYWWSR